MQLSVGARSRRSRGTRNGAAVAFGALVLLAAAAIVLPAGAPAGQSSQATPAPVAQVATGIYHSCAVLGLADARVRCWGFSGDGQLGYGNTETIGDDETPSSVGPVDLGAGRTVIALAAGDYHSCAVLDDGSVRCWGFGFEGQLGYGDREQVGDTETPGSVAPVNLGAERTATAIAAGNRHTCALLDGGDVRCWGLNEVGQLGYGTTGLVLSPASAGPVNFGPGRTAKAITAGGGHTCAILDDDSVRCWGYNTNGQLGYATTSAVLSPENVGPVDLGPHRTARAITAGDTHTCAVLDNGDVRCWGLNDVGQLGYDNTTAIGDNETPGSVAPVDLGPERTATAISAGGNQLLSEGHTCAVLDDGTVRCWGSGAFGKLGYANTTNVLSPASVGPVDLGAGRTAIAISAGGQHTCARLGDGSVQCWGNGADGRLGHCGLRAIGDDETPGSIEPVDIGFGGAACPLEEPPSAPPLPAPPAPADVAPVPTAPGVPATPAAPAPAPALAETPGAVPVTAKLALARATINRRHRVLDVLAPITRLASGNAQVELHSAGRRHRFTVPINSRDGRIRFRQRIPKAQADLGTGILTITYRGDSDTRAQTVRLRADSQRADLRLSRPTILNGRLRASGTVNDRARGVVRVQVEYVAGGETQTREFKAPITSGKWSLNQRLSQSVRTAIARRTGTVHSYTLFTGYMPRHVRGEMRSFQVGHMPGRVTTLSAKSGSGGKITLAFGAAGSDGSRAPAARSYVIKQSLRPIRTARDFQRAPALCKGACTFDVTEVGATINLEVRELRRNTTYYYAIAARDNVSKQTGPRSRTILAKTN